MSWKNDVVQDMRREGFDQASTIAAELMRQASGRKTWNRRTVLMIDEAGMISTKHFAALMTKADAAGAKVILAGDAKQLGSIEHGGMFAELQRTHGAAELKTVRRVKDVEQQGAFNAMHRGDFRAALETFDRRGAIHWNETPEATRAALVAKWAEDTAADPGKSRFVFAYTNAEVRELNAELRAIRRARGELGEDHALKTKEGDATFAAGDRVQFTGNAATQARRDEGLYNGAAGTVATIDGETMTVALDGAMGAKGAAPSVVSFKVGADAKADEFDAIRHGYAGTIYKGQGKTLDQTYLLHSDQWRSASSYVALSRHRENVALFASRKATPWIMAEGGLAGLNAKQRDSAAQSFAAWQEARPELAAKYGFADYVGYVQTQWADEKRLDPLDRLARQMSRSEENRAASHFVEGAKERPDAGRRPPLSIVAAIVGDYLRLCYDPAKDWLRWVADDLRHRAAARRDALATAQGRDDAHTERAGAAMESADRVRRNPLHELQGGLDEDGQRRRGVDRVPSRPRTDLAGNDGLRPVRTERGLDPGRDYLRDRMAEAERETTQQDKTPKKASDYLRGRGRGRDPTRDR